MRPLGVGVHDLLDRHLVGAEALAAVHERDALGGVEQVDDPVAGAVAAADDDHALARELALGADEVVGAAALPRRSCRSRAASWARRRRGRRRRSPCASAGRPLSVCRTTRSSSQEIDSAVVSRCTGTSNCSSVCCAVQLDEVLGQDLGVAGDVEDPLLRIERRELAAELGQRVDDARAGLAHAGPEGGRQAHRAGADDRDVADVVEVGMGHGESGSQGGRGHRLAVERRSARARRRWRCR